MIIPGKYLKACALFVNKKDPRGFIHGVHIEANGNAAIVTATDGPSLISCRVALAEDTPTAVFTVPIDILDSITGKSDVGISLAPSATADGLPSVTLRQGAISVSDTVVPGNFPQYRRVVPERMSGEQGWGCDMKLLTRAAKACAWINGAHRENIVMAHNGSDVQSFSTGNPDVLILICPFREKATPYARPDWLGL